MIFIERCRYFPSKKICRLLERLSDRNYFDTNRSIPNRNVENARNNSKIHHYRCACEQIMEGLLVRLVGIEIFNGCIHLAKSNHIWLGFFTAGNPNFLFMIIDV